MSASLLTLPPELLLTITLYLPHTPLQLILLKQTHPAFHATISHYETLLLTRYGAGESANYELFAGDWHREQENLVRQWRDLMRRDTERSGGILGPYHEEESETQRTSGLTMRITAKGETAGNALEKKRSSLTPYNTLCFKYFDPKSPIYSPKPSPLRPWFTSLSEYIALERYIFDSQNKDRQSRETLHLLHKLQDMVLQPFRQFTFFTLAFNLILLGCIAGNVHQVIIPWLPDPVVHLPSLFFNTSKLFIGELLVYCAYLFMESLFAPKSEEYLIPAFLVTSVLSLVIFVLYWIAQRILTLNSARSISSVNANWWFYPITAFIAYKVIRMRTDWRRHWVQFASLILLGLSYLLLFVRLDELLPLSWTLVLLPVFVWDVITIHHTVREGYTPLLPLMVLAFAWLKFLFCIGQVENWGLFSSSPLIVCGMLSLMKMTMPL